MAISPVTMPQLGESVTEGTIGKWLKQPGDRVEKYESIAEVITDKVNAEIPSPVSGVIRELKVEEGATVPVGTEILTIDDGGDAAEAPAPQPAAAASATPVPAAPAPAPQPETPAPAPVAAVASAPAAPAAPAATVPASPAPVAAGTDNGRAASQPPADMGAAVAANVPASEMQHYSSLSGGPSTMPQTSSDYDEMRKRYTPAVRRLAEEHGVALHEVKGTGSGGRVTKEDVLQYVAQRSAAPAPAPAAPSAPAPAAPTPVAPAQQPSAPATAPAPPQAPSMPVLTGDTPMGLTPMRRAIAEHMVRSVHTSPHAWTSVEIDMTNVVKYRESIKKSFEQREGISITYLPFFIKAVVDAVKQVPQVNAVWNDEQGVVLKREINVGVPIDIGEGLIVPVMHGADNLSVTGIARKVHELAERARANKLTLADIQGGTITVNNTGSLGTIMTHSIINQPQACLVTMEAVVKRPVVIDDAIAIRSMMYSVIALDHRILDGAVGARFLRLIKQSLEGFDPSAAGL